MKQIITLLLVCIYSISFSQTIELTEITNHGLDAHFQGSLNTDGQNLVACGFTSLILPNDPTFATSYYLNDGSGFFTEDTSFPILDLTRGDVIPANLDNQNGTDYVVIGSTLDIPSDTTEIIGMIYLDDGTGGYTIQNINGLSNGNVGLGDLDNDGDLDLWSEGGLDTVPTTWRRFVYRNDGGVFVEVINTDMDAVWIGDITITDTDNDGDLDVVISGETNAILITTLYRNDGNFVFTPLTDVLPTIIRSSHTAGDINNDGNMDIIISGIPVPQAGRTIDVLFGNGDNTFTLNQSLLGLTGSSSALDDIDNDGDLDFYITGMLQESDPPGSTFFDHFYVYENDGLGNFSLFFTTPAADDGDLIVFDMDSDGDNDLILMGDEFSVPMSGPLVKVFRNDSNACDEVAWYEDVDNDGLGDPNVMIMACDQPDGFVDNDDDLCPDDFDPSNANFDGDNLGDVCDEDDDNDGFSDEAELACGSDPFDADETCDTLGINDFNQATIALYPNPVENILTIRNTSTNNITDIKVYSFEGRLLFTKTRFIEYIDFGDFEAGIYFINMTINNRIFTRKIIKQ